MEGFCAPRFYDNNVDVITTTTGAAFCRKKYGKNATCYGSNCNSIPKDSGLCKLGVCKADAVASNNIVCRVASCKADPKQCCITGKDADSDEICDTKYTNLSSCNPIMNSFCSGDKVFKHDRCAQWATINKAAGDVLKSKYCSAVENVAKPECSTWCIQNPGKCDAGAKTFCEQLAKENTANDFCSCINNNLRKLTNGKYKPTCSDHLCKTRGYVTSEMLADTAKCNDIIDCSQFINLSPDDKTNILKSVTVTQNCSATPVDIAKSVANDGTSTNNVPTTNTPTVEKMQGGFSFNENYTNVLTLLFILFVFVLCIMAMKHGNFTKYIKPANPLNEN